MSTQPCINDASCDGRRDASGCRSMFFHHERDSAILPVIIGPALQNKICPRVPSLSLIVLMILFKTELNLQENTLGFSFKCVTHLIINVFLLGT